MISDNVGALVNSINKYTLHNMTLKLNGVGLFNSDLEIKHHFTGLKSLWFECFNT